MARVTAAPLTDKAALLERFKDFPAINVIERRLLNPNDPGSLPILLKDEPNDPCLNTEHHRQLKPGAAKCHLCRKATRKHHIHWCNTNIEGRWAQMKAKGYVPVTVKELKDQEDVADLVQQTEESGEKWVRRGDRGKEVLMRQPLEVYTYIKNEQQRVRNAKFKSKKAMQEELAESAGHALGDEAGQMLHDGGIQVESVSRQRTSLGKEAGGED